MLMNSSIRRVRWTVQLLALVLTHALLASQIMQAQTLNTLYGFAGAPDGKQAMGSLARAADGSLYGTTREGGTYNNGAVFKINSGGGGTILYSFTGASGDGAVPEGGLVFGPNNILYGTTRVGGAYGYGTVFEVTESGVETVLYSFTGGADGGYPWAPVLADSAGNVYGTTFAGGDLNCTIYQSNGYNGCGTVFEVTPGGIETVLHSFTGANGDGAGLQYAGLIMDAAANLYGVTEAGGKLKCSPGYGCGVIFKIITTGKKAGKEMILHKFSGKGGESPLGTLYLDSSGNLFGTTYGGGNLKCQAPYGCGTVFERTSTGKEIVLYAFGNNDGQGPLSGVVPDANGNFYGTTNFAGDPTCQCGTVFMVNASGETILHTFTGGNDGAGPIGTMTIDSAGNLYGTTFYAGPGGYGTVFELTP
jgi:uncharacterized repeat protein (TIGR03803 family)